LPLERSDALTSRIELVWSAVMKSAAIALDEHDQRGESGEESVGEAQPKVHVILLPAGGDIILV
jgi:hypothetical protein